jgi:hypothetical protein
MRMEIAMQPSPTIAPRVRTSASGKRAINLTLSSDVLDAAKRTTPPSRLTACHWMSGKVSDGTL